MQISEFRKQFRLPALRWWLVLLAITGLLGLDRFIDPVRPAYSSFSDLDSDGVNDETPPEVDFVEAPARVPAPIRPRSSTRPIGCLGLVQHRVCPKRTGVVSPIHREPSLTRSPADRAGIPLLC